MSFRDPKIWQWMATNLVAIMIGGFAAWTTIINTIPRGLNHSEVETLVGRELAKMPPPISATQVREIMRDELDRRPTGMPAAEVSSAIERDFHRLDKERGGYTVEGKPRIAALEARASHLEEQIADLGKLTQATTSALKESIVRMEVLIDVTEKRVADQPAQPPTKTSFFRR